MFALFICCVCTPATGYLVFKNYQCKQYMYGVSDSELVIKEGIVFLRGDDTPYTGSAFSTVCGGECGFMLCTLLHWRGTYKEGRLHGEFDAPMSGIGDKYWFTPGDETQTYFFRNGARIK
ncbi:hypothetical protein [Bermanella sp. R86510]|uniref:hypothetical protein n=1 Tax=unclassified Bermanella TaxID=2627862 RepID=UPI0037CC2422